MLTCSDRMLLMCGAFQLLTSDSLSFNGTIEGRCDNHEGDRLTLRLLLNLHRSSVSSSQTNDGALV